MKHIQTHNFALTQEELKIIIQAIECFIAPKKPRWAKDEATRITKGFKLFGKYYEGLWD